MVIQNQIFWNLVCKIEFSSPLHTDVGYRLTYLICRS